MAAMTPTVPSTDTLPAPSAVVPASSLENGSDLIASPSLKSITPPTAEFTNVANAQMAGIDAAGALPSATGGGANETTPSPAGRRASIAKVIQVDKPTVAKDREIAKAMLRRYAILSSILALVSGTSFIIANEIEWSEIGSVYGHCASFSQGNVGVRVAIIIFQLIVTITSIGIVWCVYIHHTNKWKLGVITNKFTSVGGFWNSHSARMFFVEAVVVGIHAPPGVTGCIAWGINLNDGSPSYTAASVFSIIILVTRLHLPIRAYRNSSRFISSQASVVSKLYSVRLSSYTGLKDIMERKTFQVMGGTVSFTILLFGYVLMCFERAADHGFHFVGLENGGESYWDNTYAMCLWYVWLCMTTIGFGDWYPLTPMGRLISVCSNAIGMVLTALMIGLVSEAIAWQQSESKVKHSLDFLENKKQLPHLCADMIKAWITAHAKRSKGLQSKKTAAAARFVMLKKQLQNLQRSLSEFSVTTHEVEVEQSLKDVVFVLEGQQETEIRRKQQLQELEVRQIAMDKKVDTLMALLQSTQTANERSQQRMLEAQASIQEKLSTVAAASAATSSAVGESVRALQVAMQRGASAVAGASTSGTPMVSAMSPIMTQQQSQNFSATSDQERLHLEMQHAKPMLHHGHGDSPMLSGVGLGSPMSPSHRSVLRQTSRVGMQVSQFASAVTDAETVSNTGPSEKSEQSQPALLSGWVTAPEPEPTPATDAQPHDEQPVSARKILSNLHDAFLGSDEPDAVASGGDGDGGDGGTGGGGGGGAGSGGGRMLHL